MAKRTQRVTEIDQRIGANLRQFRINAGLSQTELGAQLGVTFQQVQKYETGANRLSGSRMVVAAEALGCTVADLTECGGEAVPLLDAAIVRLARRLQDLAPERRANLVRSFDRIVAAFDAPPNSAERPPRPTPLERYIEGAAA